MTFITRFRNHIHRYLTSDEGGVSTVEFVILFPVYVLLICASYEVGYYTFNKTLLDRGVNGTVRDIRIARLTDITHENLVTGICTHAGYIPSCTSNVLVSTYPLDLDTISDIPNVKCISDVTPATPLTTIAAGSENQLALMQVCMSVNPIFPTTTVGMALQQNDEGEMFMVSNAAFVIEPE